MTRTIPTPDPQRSYLNALEDAIDAACVACQEAQFDRDEIEACFPAFNEETGRAGYESVVFYGDHWDNGYDDPEEFREIVQMVGGRDLQYKIEEAERTLANLNSLLSPPDPCDCGSGRSYETCDCPDPRN